MLETFHIHMTSFKQDRQIRVYLPKSYNEEKKKYPVCTMDKMCLMIMMQSAVHH